jgi:hypothetical protein
VQGDKRGAEGEAVQRVRKVQRGLQKRRGKQNINGNDDTVLKTKEYF